MNFQTRFVNIVRRECNLILSDSNILLVLVLAPLAYLLIFGFEYYNKKAYNLSVVVVDKDASQLSRTMIRSLDAHESIRVAEVMRDETDLQQKFITEEAWAAVVIPKYFERNIKRGNKVNALMMVNSANIVIYDYAAVGAQTVLATVGAGVSIGKMMKRGAPSYAALDNYSPIGLQNRILFNPTLTYANFILPLLFMLLLHQVIALGAGMSWAKEFEEKSVTGHSSVVIGNLGDWRFVFAKSVPYALLVFVWLAIMLLGAHTLLAVPFEGNPLLLIPFGLLLSVDVTLLAALVGSWCKSKVGVVQMLFFYSMPAFLISGTVWPLSAMPKPIEWLALMLPSTHVLTAYRRIALEGAGFVALSSTFGWLVLLGVVLFVVLRWKLNVWSGRKNHVV